MVQKISIDLGANRVNPLFSTTADDHLKIFTPGEIISRQSSFIRGHGTYVEDDALKSSVAGVVDKVNRLITVKPHKTRYHGEIGDVVVGRITEVQQKRWKVDISARLDAILLLSSVNLPGGEIRRRSTEDEQTMRKYMIEGDLVSAEVQNIFSDGGLSLHTRSFKYGKLSQGVLVKVSPSLIKKSKTHFHNLTSTISIILGNNGFVWIYPNTDTEPNTTGGFTQNIEQTIELSDRESVARIRNCVLALVASKIPISYTTILYAYQESEKFQISELLHSETMLDISIRTKHRLEIAED